MNSKEELYKKIDVFNSNLINYITASLSTRKAFNPTVYNLWKNVFDQIFPSNNGKNINFESIDNFAYNTNSKLAGVYYFFLITDNIQEFKEDWGAFKKSNDKVPALNEEITPISNNMYLLYIGKSEYSLNKRLDNHINSGSSSTYCLRLKEFNNKYYEKYSFKYGYLSAKDKNKEHICKILYIVESFLREEFPPILGRK
ncbi:hypothetical protein [Bacillus sp. RS11]|uniref:hypothetical protein n=1 Tax=Lysinibacillus sp. RS11 TaxID=3242682 RepID=UPI0035C6623A